MLNDLCEEMFGENLSDRIPEDQTDSSCHKCCDSIKNWLSYLKKAEDERNAIVMNLEHFKITMTVMLMDLWRNRSVMIKF